MAYIYQPRGPAREYSDWAFNLYKGCSHGCKYCYAPDATHTDRETFLKPQKRAVDWRVLNREMQNIPRGKSVFLCFTCDPYQPLEESEQVTRRAIQLLHNAGLGVIVLTKGGNRSGRDFSLLAERPDLSQYGATLTFISDADSSKWEPGAACPSHRLSMLKKAHDFGIPTWASLEPVIDPIQSLELIQVAAPFVDLFKVGKWNHDARANAIDWPAFGREAIALFESLKKPFYIKADLNKAMHN